MPAKRQRWAAPAGIAGIALLFIAVHAGEVTRASDDAGLVAVLNADEALSVRIVRRMLADGTLDPGGFFSYGALLHDLAALLLSPLAITGTVGDRAVIITLRLIALAAAGGAIVLTGILAGRLAGGIAGAGAALLLAVTAEVSSWSITAHPDTLQLALIAATLVVVCPLTERASWRRAAVCGALAGLACAAKYAGLLLVPLLLLAVAAGSNRAATGWVVRRTAIGWAAMLAAFALAFAMTNPYALATPRAFVGQVRAELAHAQSGHVFDEGNGGGRWLLTLASPALGGPFTPVLAVTGAVLLLRRRQPAASPRRSWWTALLLLDSTALLALWAIAFMAYLVLRVGYGAPRYALPVLPVTAAFAGAAVGLAARQPLPRGTAPVLATCLMVAAAALPLVTSRQRAAVRQEAAAGLDNDPRVLAGRWLRQDAEPNAVLLTDAYVYIPPEFARVTVTFGLTEAQLTALRPALILVNEDIRGRFRWDVGAARYVDGPAAYAERQAAYAALEEGTVDCYAPVADFGAVQVYRRTCP